MNWQFATLFQLSKDRNKVTLPAAARGATDEIHTHAHAHRQTSPGNTALYILTSALKVAMGRGSSILFKGKGVTAAAAATLRA